jgi:hypothetical protein
MSEIKSFGFEKKKNKTNLIAFRLDDLHYAKLLKLFERLQVKPKKDNITNRMTILIDRLGDLLVEHDHLVQERHSYAGKVAQSEAQKRELLHEVKTLVSKALDQDTIQKEKPKERSTPKPKPQSKEPTPAPVIELPQRLEPPEIPIVNAAMLTPIEKGKTILEKHGLIETRTPVCAKGHKFLNEQQCDVCSYHTYCNYSTANKHFKSHEAI